MIASTFSTKFRMLPPSAAPLRPADILAGLKAMANPHEALDSLREAVQKKFGVRHAFFATSGRAGLSAGLRALRRLNPDRDEVLLPAYTSFSVPSAVVNAGLKVSLYDLQADTLAPDMESLERAMGPRTLCVVACHLFGYPVDLKPIETLCRQHGAALFDDAAQAMGASIGGRLAGTMGDVGLFSLSRGKNMTAVDGGIVLTDRDDVAEGLAGLLPPESFSLAAFFRNCVHSSALLAMLHPRAYWLPASIPFLHIGASVFDPEFASSGMEPYRCGLASNVLNRLDLLNSARRTMAASLLVDLNELETVCTIRPMHNADPVFLRLPVLPTAGVWPGGNTPDNPTLGVVRSYPQPLHEISLLKAHLVTSGTFPVSAMLAKNLVTLPTHVFVQKNDAAKMMAHFHDFFSNRAEESIWFSSGAPQQTMGKQV